jgi:hypothetical protein
VKLRWRTVTQSATFHHCLLWNVAKNGMRQTSSEKSGVNRRAPLRGRGRVIHREIGEGGETKPGEANS